PTGDNRVEFEAVNMDPRVYIEDDMGPDQVILTSRLYPIEFGDGIAPGLVAPGVRKLPMPRSEDSVEVGLLPPVISRRTVTRYLEYDNGEPESISVGLLSPVISRRTVTRYLEYDNAEPEAIRVGLLAPSVSRRKHPV